MSRAHPVQFQSTPSSTIPERMTRRCRVKDDHGEVHPLDKLHHLGVAHGLIDPGEGPQQLLDHSLAVPPGVVLTHPCQNQQLKPG